MLHELIFVRSSYDWLLRIAASRGWNRACCQLDAEEAGRTSSALLISYRGTSCL